MSANRAVIVSGAINAQADISTLTVGAAPFSNPGASILVSAPGSNVASTSRIRRPPDDAHLPIQYNDMAAEAANTSYYQDHSAIAA